MIFRHPRAGVLDYLCLFANLPRDYSKSDGNLYLEEVLVGPGCLNSMKWRVSQGKRAMFIHGSGAGALDDDSLGIYKGDVIYYDNDPEKIDEIGPEALHRRIDLEVVKAAMELGKTGKLAIMIAHETYRFNPTHKSLNSQIPTITCSAIKHGFAGNVGKRFSESAAPVIAFLGTPRAMDIDAMQYKKKK